MREPCSWYQLVAFLLCVSLQGTRKEEGQVLRAGEFPSSTKKNTNPNVGTPTLMTSSKVTTSLKFPFKYHIGFYGFNLEFERHKHSVLVTLVSVVFTQLPFLVWLEVSTSQWLWRRARSAAQIYGMEYCTSGL